MSIHASLKMNEKVPDKDHHYRESPFDDLPTEIKVMILCHMPEVSSLSSTVHASPTYHQAYLGAREEILHKITIQTLQKNNIDLLDPWTAVHSPRLDSSHQGLHRVEIIEERLERYAQGPINSSKRRLAPQDSLAILSLQRKFTVLIAEYCKAVLSINPLTQLADDDPRLPSHHELNRLYRALWRYEVYSKLFAPFKPSFRRLRQIGIEPTDYALSEAKTAYRFFELFPIHEVEEMACLEKYAGDYYRPLSWKEHQLVSSGPTLLHDVMTAASENERKTRIAEVEKDRMVHFTMRDILDINVTWGNVPGKWWKGAYDKFVSERAPTAGWLWASRSGTQKTDFSLRRWGYVFWDQERLDAWGIMQENIINWPDPGAVAALLNTRNIPHNEL